MAKFGAIVFPLARLRINYLVWPLNLERKCVKKRFLNNTFVKSLAGGKFYTHPMEQGKCAGFSKPRTVSLFKKLDDGECVVTLQIHQQLCFAVLAALKNLQQFLQWLQMSLISQEQCTK